MNSGFDDNAPHSADEDILRRPQHHAQTMPETADDHRIRPSKDASVNAADVLCGRGKISINHAGNMHFRKLVRDSIARFEHAESRQTRANIVQSIVDDVRQSGGRFLKRDRVTGQWSELSDQQTKGKVGHAVRDALSAAKIKSKRQETGHSSGTKQEVESPSAEVGSHTLQLQPSSSAPLHSFISLNDRIVPPTDYAARNLHEYNIHALNREPVVHEDTNDDEFVQNINQTLGQLPSDMHDPIGELLDNLRHSDCY